MEVTSMVLNPSTSWSQQRWSLAQVVEGCLPAAATSVRIINGQLWCCCGLGGIVILNTMLRLQRIIPSKVMEKVWDVAETSDWDVVAAALGGLYVLSPDGT